MYLVSFSVVYPNHSTINHYTVWQAENLFSDISLLDLIEYDQHEEFKFSVHVMLR